MIESSKQRNIMSIKSQNRNLALMISIASQAHVHQFDRGGNPYIMHPLAVMMMVKQSGGDFEQQQIAVGHDLFEDTEVDAAHLSALGISSRVIDGIQAMTKIEGETYEQYKEKVKGNRDAVIVKMADLRHNTDVSRLNKTVLSEKDIARIVKYNQFYLELQSIVNQND